jgi:hypothetical protein
MPLHDGTGPRGLGPGSGRRRRGRCFTNVFQSGFDRKPGWLFGVLLPLGTAIVRDLLNPSGVIRRIVHVTSAPKIDNNTQKIRRNAEFTVVDTDSVPTINGKKISE